MPAAWREETAAEAEVDTTAEIEVESAVEAAGVIKVEAVEAEGAVGESSPKQS